MIVSVCWYKGGHIVRLFFRSQSAIVPSEEAEAKLSEFGENAILIASHRAGMTVIAQEFVMKFPCFEVQSA